MKSLKNSKILITGGAGLVGSFVAEGLIAEEPKEILILDNFFRGTKSNLENILNSPNLRVVEGDIRDSNVLKQCMQGADYCFHLAALRITHCAADPKEALSVMYDGTFQVLQAAQEFQLKKIVFASSASIYGQADSFPTKETHHPYNNRTLYGAAKTANELMLRSFYQMYGLNYVALRYFNIYGPRMDTFGKYTEVLIRWYHLIKNYEAPLIYGDGKQTMDFIYIEDIARATILALKSDLTDRVFNVASGQETSLEELCWLLLEVMNSPLKPKYVPLTDERKKVEVQRRLADVSAARGELGFSAKINLKEGLKNLVDWLDLQTRELKAV